MTTLRKVQSMLGLALVTALGALAFSASAEEATPAEETTPAEEITPADETMVVPEDALYEQADQQPYIPYIPPGSLRCTMSGQTETGREWGAIYMTNKPGICRRIRVGGPAPVDFPSCHSRGMNELGCQVVVD